MKRWVGGTLLLGVLALPIACGRVTAPAVSPTPAESPASIARDADAAATATTKDLTEANAASAALIERVVHVIFLDPKTASIVPFDSAALLIAAYERAVQAPRAPGAPPAPGTPAFIGDPLTDLELFRPAYLDLLAGVHSAIDRAGLTDEVIRALVDRANAPNPADQCSLGFADARQIVSDQVSEDGLPVDGSSIGTETIIRGQFLPFDRDFIIREVNPGSPAARVGLKPGDTVLAVDGMAVSGMPLKTVVGRVRGTPGTTVTLTIQRTGDTTARVVMLSRAPTTIPLVVSRIMETLSGRRVGYIRIHSFSTAVVPQLQRVLADFEAQGVTAWLLDDRGTVGGSAAGFKVIAGQFIGVGLAAILLQRSGARTPLVMLPKDFFIPKHSLAVLVGSGTRGAGEALAAAVQENGVGRVFGQQTAGCVAVSSNRIPLPDGSRLDVSTMFLLTGMGRNMYGVGLTPDEVVVLDSTWRTDPVLDAALAWLATQP